MYHSKLEILSNDGVRIRTKLWGAGNPTLFLIHGLGEGSFVWDHLISSLSAYGPLAAVDLRGHGDSEHDPQGEYAASTFSEDVVQILDLVAGRGITLVGHSLGAQVAIRAALARKCRVRALVLIDGGLSLSRPASSVMSQAFCSQPWRYRAVDDYAQELVKKYPLASRSVLEPLASQSLRRGTDGLLELKCDPVLGDLFGADDDPSLWERLPEITCPVLILRGSGSSVFPKHVAERIAASMAHATLTVIPAAGHAVMLDNPAVFLAELRTFLHSLRSGRGYADSQRELPARYATHSRRDHHAPRGEGDI